LQFIKDGHYCPLKIKQAATRIYPDYAAYTDYLGEAFLFVILSSDFVLSI